MEATDSTKIPTDSTAPTVSYAIRKAWVFEEAAYAEKARPNLSGRLADKIIPAIIASRNTPPTLLRSRIIV